VRNPKWINLGEWREPGMRRVIEALKDIDDARVDDDEELDARANAGEVQPSTVSVQPLSSSA